MIRRSLRILIHALGILAGLAVLALLGLAWRLGDGPIVLGEAAPYLEEAINDSTLGIAVRVGDVVVSGGDWRRTFDLKLLNVLVFDETGQVAFASREIGLAISLPALLQAEVRPVGITLSGSKIDLVRDENGAISFALTASLGSAAPEASGLSGDRSLLERILLASSMPPLERLEHVGFKNADLTFDDRKLGLVWHAPDSGMSIGKHAGEIRLSLAAVLRSGSQALPLEVVGVHRLEDSGIDVSGRLTDIWLPSLPELVPSLPDLSGAALAVDTGFHLSFDSDLELTEGTFLLESPSGHVDVPELFEHPFDLGPTSLRGTLAPGFDGLEVTDFFPGIRNGRLGGRLLVSGWTNEAAVELTIDANDLPVDDLALYWPVVTAPPARGWIMNHLSQGLIGKASLAFRSTLGDLTADDPPTEGLTVNVEAGGVTIDFLEGMPPLKGVDGHVEVAGESVRIESRGGSIAGVTTPSGLITMAGFDRAMAISVDLEGPIHEALAIAGHESLSFPQESRFEPETLDGSFSGVLEITIANLVDPGADEIDYRFGADLDDLGFGIGDHLVDGGSGAISLEAPGVLDFEGQARLDGVPVSVSYRLALDGDPAVRESLVLTGNPDETGRAALGLIDPVGVSGPVDATVSRTVAGSGMVTWHVRADLQEAAFGLPSLGGAKARGEPGHIVLDAVEEGGELVIRTLDILGGTVAARAAGTIGPDSLDLDFERLAIGRTDVRGSVASSADGGYVIRLEGGSIDMVPLGGDDTGVTVLPPLRIGGTVNRLWTTDDRLVNNLKIEAVLENDRFEFLDANGEISGGSLVILAIRRVSPDERRFEYRAEDMGDTVRVFAEMDNIIGGVLTVKGWFDERQTPAVTIGTVQVERFSVQDAPVLAHLFSLASLPGLESILRNEGLVFRAALLPFRREGDLLTVKDGRLFGQGIRVLLDGTVDTGRKTVDFSGTMVPDNLFNTILENVPIIGDILTGPDEHGGIFAFTFEVDGPADDPAVRVNPLSILAPGILRKLFTDTSE